MKPLTTTLLASAALSLLVACGGDGHDGHDHADHEHGAVSDATVPSDQAQTHALICGCALEEVGACGEYIEVDGEFVALEAPIDLGYMPFCHKDGLQARADGELKDGKFVATTFAMVD
ncbi:hypothetical protein [Engelhardtia mirabilis]|uniref:Uncharacterized protein n=1 Tax=Engelhardtia mirabilis TaxID=2528011 RepID=A0A518BMX6_9BACT|nr:hypothetical protein Pla133_33920 [Planctomycetes bacterium Pla133]QDV02622.1 hypothetical protein Pla86_33910 [Planctomycetes bacterium Pla86]